MKTVREQMWDEVRAGIMERHSITEADLRKMECMARTRAIERKIVQHMVRYQHHETPARMKREKKLRRAIARLNSISTEELSA